MNQFLIEPNDNDENTNILLTYCKKNSDKQIILALVLVTDLTTAIAKIKSEDGTIKKLRFVGYDNKVTINFT